MTRANTGENVERPELSHAAAGDVDDHSENWRVLLKLNIHLASRYLPKTNENVNPGEDTQKCSQQLYS